MGAKNYIVALELGSSKVTGAVGVENYDGINIIAYACEPVNGFIAKGVVRNIDETGKCLNSIINKLETQLDGANIQKAYVALGGLTIHSVKSSVTREFSEYTKITQELIDELALENDSSFIAPDGYQKVQVLAQEYKLMGGDVSLNPIGMSVKRIEGNYINIIVKEQLMKQLEESFRLAKIEIADSFTAAKIAADTLLNEEEKRDGCALVDIGAETTTVTIYAGNLLRKLCVLPLGSANITKDLCTEHISQSDAEMLKIHAGYKSENFGESSISNELRDNIIGARMMEILQNVNQQMRRSGENISNVVITGGGAKLKNIEILIAENITGVRTRIVTDPLIDFNTGNNLKLKRGELNATLYGLLKTGKENCCQEPEPKKEIMPDMFKDIKEDVEEVKIETPKKEPENKSKDEGKKKGDKKQPRPGLFSNFGDIFGGFKKNVEDFVNNATKEENDDYGSEENDEEKKN